MRMHGPCQPRRTDMIGRSPVAHVAVQGEMGAGMMPARPDKSRQGSEHREKRTTRPATLAGSEAATQHGPAACPAPSPAHPLAAGKQASPSPWMI